jgi:hypothetical protein
MKVALHRLFRAQGLSSMEFVCWNAELRVLINHRELIIDNKVLFTAVALNQRAVRPTAKMN